MILRVWVVLALIGGGITEVQAKQTAWFNQEAEISGSFFELPLDGIRKGAVNSAKVHKAGRKELIVFIPGVRSPKRIRTYTEGPIKSVKIRKVKRGTVVVLRTRSLLKNLKRRLVLVGGEAPRLEFQGSDLVSKPEVPIIEKKKARSKSSVKGNAKKKVSKDQASLAEPKVDVTGQGEIKTFPWMKNKKKVVRKPLVGLPASAGKSSLAASGMLGLLLLACMATVWALRRKKTLEETVGGIQVVAIQPFGNKHKLALVKTCGEKLLIAASDKDIRLISHVGSDLIDESSMRAVMGSGEGAFQPPETPAPSSSEVTPSISNLVMPKGTVGGNLGFGNQPVSRDLDGLVALRKEQSQFANAEGLLGHFSKKYQRNGAAA